MHTDRMLLISYFPSSLGPDWDWGFYMFLVPRYARYPHKENFMSCLTRGAQRGSSLAKSPIWPEDAFFCTQGSAAMLDVLYGTCTIWLPRIDVQCRRQQGVVYDKNLNMPRQA